MITTVCGLSGQGKSLYLAWLIWRYWQAGQMIFTNVDLTQEHPAYDSVYALDYVEPSTGEIQYPVYDPESGQAFWDCVPAGACIIIDEVDEYFDSADFNKLTKAGRGLSPKTYWKQRRKFRHRVILSAQSPENVYVRIRRQCHEWIWCFRDGPDTGIGDVGLWWHLVPETFYRYRRHYYSHWRMSERDLIKRASFSNAEATSLFSWYRTDQVVGKGVRVA